ncbi:MAG: O-antigen ligase family protein [Micromonosporaceae bacterium]|nr:O-antigen ligase family protein [Micromonosporaceae bacterium]
MAATTIHVSDWEPSLAFDQTYVTRRRPTYIDAARALGLMLILLGLVPARLIVPGMTDLGRPGLLLGFLLFCWWGLVRFSPQLVMTGRQPTRWSLLVFMVTVLISYAMGLLRGLTTMEVNSADRVMLFFCVFTGVALTAADGIPNWLRLRGVLRVLVGVATIVSAIALVQYTLNLDITRYLAIPGLEEKGWVPGFEERGAGVRVASTTTHYIELASYLAMVLPFAIHFAWFGHRPHHRRLALGCAVLMAGGIAVTISRTGVLAAAIVLIVLFCCWTWRMRYTMLVWSFGLLAAVIVASPGLGRTLLHLFDDPSSNPAFTVRQERYPMVFAYVAQRPWFGRGTGTWVMPQYQVLDNQWLVTLAANGIVGVVALAAVHLTAIVLAWLSLRRSQRAEDRHLCAALIATQLLALAVAGTFDSLSYMTYSTTMAVTVGMCGTVWRLTHPARAVRTSTTRWFLR